ncbi:MAG: hypothetical protein GT589_05800 [Peptoclostridium sp.]|nr:hypothetical protein [Peptoclostridium sp.]
MRHNTRIKPAAICFLLTTALMLGQVSYGQEAVSETTQEAAEQKEAAPDVAKEAVVQEEPANEEPVYDVSEKAQEAADFLMGLGLAHGKEDGKFHPEQGITREEFAKLLVGVLGLEKEALLSKGEQIFTDVEKDRWSHHYVSMAVSVGMTRGFEDGSFRPEESVTRAQAAAMLVRCFGYNDSYVQGSWPANYISKAAELGILSGAEGEHSAALGRGDAALMVRNALHGKYLFGDDEGRMLMSKKRGIYQVRGARLLKLTNYLDIESMEFEITSDSELDGGMARSGEKYIFANPSGIYMQPGEELVLYVDKDENILYVPRPSNAVNGNAVQTVGMKTVDNAYDQKPYGMIKLAGEESYIEVDSDSTIMLDGKNVNSEEYESVLVQDAYGSFVVEKGRLEYANLISWDSGDFVVKSLDAQTGRVMCIDTQGGVEDSLTLSGSKAAYEFYVVSSGGSVQKADFGTLKAGDVFRVGNENKITKTSPVYVFRNNAEGTFERVSGGSNGKSITFRLKGVTDSYQLADSFAYSYNGGKRVRAGSEGSSSIASSLNEFYNQKVKIYRNYADDVIYIEGNFSLVIDQYGVLLDYGDAVRGEIKLLTQAGSKRVFAFEDSEEYEYLKSRVEVGTIVKYSQINTGTIKNLSDDFSENIIYTDDISIINSGDDFTEDSVEIGGQTYKVDSDTVFFDYSEQDPDKVKRLTWDKFKGREVVGDVEVIADTDGDYLLMMAIWSNLEGIKEDTKVGYVLDNFSLGDYKYVELQEYGSEGVKSYKLEDEYKDLMLFGRLIAFQIATSDKIKIVEDEELEFVSGELTSADNRYISIEGTSYRTEDDAIGFGGGMSINVEGFDEGDLVAAYIEDGKLVAVEDLGAQPDAKIAQGVLLSVDPDLRECFVIDVDGNERSFACAEDADFVFRDGYMEIEDEGMDPVELFGMLAEGGETVKFSYNKYTEEIYSIWIDANQ